MEGTPIPFSTLITSLRVDLAQFQKDWREAERLAGEHHRRIQQMAGSVRIAGAMPAPGAAGGPARLQVLGPGGMPRGSASAQMREEVRDQLASFRQIVSLRKELSAAEDRASRERRAQNQREEREREARRANELRSMRQDILERERIRNQTARAASREAIASGQATPLGGAGQRLQRLREERLAAQISAEDARFAANQRAQRRAEEARAATLTSTFGLPSRAQEAAQARRAAMVPRGPGGPGGIPRPPDIENLNRLVGSGLAGAFDKATRAANALSLITNVSLLGGLGGLVAEGIRLNSQFEKLNITMAATLGLSNKVVDEQGKLVEGPERTNFLLQRTAGFYEVIRDVAAKTIVGQQELTETVAENLALAQRAGFVLTDVSEEQQRAIVGQIANVASLAKAIGLPGGQRQLSQEVRALFTGERIQGATITRLLGLNSVSDIQRLQAIRKEPGGETKFIEEIGKRFKTVQPIIDKFEGSMAGIFEALISQAKEFLRIATSTAFGKIREVLLGVRENLTAEAVAAAATRLGNSIGEIVGHLIAVGRAMQPFFRFLGFLVDNASTIIAVLAAFRALRVIQAISGGVGGAGGIAGLLGQLAGGAGAGAAGVGAAGAAGAGAAAGAGGIGAAIAARRATIARHLGMRVGPSAAARAGLAVGAAGRGIGLAAPIAGAAGITGVTGLGIAGLTGAGIGTGLNFLGQGLPELLAERQVSEEGRRAEQTERVRNVEPILRQRQRARELRRRAEELRRGQQAPTVTGEQISPHDFFLTPIATFGRLAGQFAGRGRAAELTGRVTPEALERGSMRAEEKANKLILQRREEFNREQRLKARLALAEVIRDREAALKIQAKLDQEAAIQEFTDKEARAVKLVAIERKLQRDLRELREDERLQNRETILESLKDEEQLIRIRAQRARLQAQRNIRDPRERAAVLGAIDLGTRRALIQQFLTRQEEGASARGELAGAEGRSLDVIREEGRRRLVAAGRLLADQKISLEEFHRFERGIIRDTARKEIEERRRVRDQAIDFGQQIVDLARRSFELQRDYEENLAKHKARLRDRDIANVKARLNEEDTLRRAFQARIDARVDQSLFKQRRAQQEAAMALLGQRRTVTGTISPEQAAQLNALGGVGAVTAGPFRRQEESVADVIRRRIGRQIGEQRLGLTREQRETLTTQRTAEFARELVDTLTGEAGIEGALEKLRELGVNVTNTLRQQLADVAFRATGTREDERVFGQIREAQQVRERVVDADKGLIEAQDARREREIEDRRSLREEARDRQRLDDDFRQAQAQLAIEFGRTQEAIRLFAAEAQRAGIALSQGITAIFQTFLGARVPAPEAGVAGEAQRQLGRAGAPRGGGTPDRRRSEGGDIYLNIGQLGADTRELVEKLREKLERDARRTPIS